MTCPARPLVTVVLGALLVGVCGGSPAVASGGRSGVMLAAGARNLVLSVLRLRLAEADARESVAERERVDAAVKRVMEDRTAAGDAAVAYLLTVYLGEGRAESLVCDAINRGTRIVPLVRAFAARRPSVGMEPLPAILVIGADLSRDVLDAIERGQRCEYE